MRRLRQKIPQEGNVRAWYGRRNIGSGVSQIQGKDFDSRRSTSKTRTEWQDASTVGSGTFWKDYNYSFGVVGDEFVEIDHASTWRWILMWLGEGSEDGS